MLTDRSTLTLAGTFVAITAAFFLLSWAPYQRAAATNDTIETVHHRVQNQQQELDSLAALAERVKSVRETIDADMRHIPYSTDMASLITALAVEVDHVLVHDQTFTAGKIRTVEAGEEEHVLALPLTIDMDATFGVVFDMLRRVEEMKNLVRVTSVVMERHATHDHLVRATVHLEAIFEAPDADSKEGPAP